MIKITCGKSSRELFLPIDHLLHKAMQGLVQSLRPSSRRISPTIFRLLATPHISTIPTILSILRIPLTIPTLLPISLPNGNILGLP